MSVPVNLQTIPASGQPEVPLNENFYALDGIAVYSVDLENTAGLTLGLLGGRWGGFSVARDTYTLTDDDGNYITVDRSDGSVNVSISDTNWNDGTNYARLYIVTTADGVIELDTVEDHRMGPGGILAGEAGPPGSAEGVAIVTISTNDVSYAILKSNAGKYHRFTGTGAKTCTFDNVSSPGPDLEAPEEYHVTNRGASGDLTIAGDGVTLNAPAGGTLILNPGMTVTVKMISSSVADVFGQTQAA